MVGSSSNGWSSVKLRIGRWNAAVVVLTHCDFYHELRDLYCHVIRIAITYFSEAQVWLFSVFQKYAGSLGTYIPIKQKFTNYLHFNFVPLQSWFSCFSQAVYTTGSVLRSPCTFTTHSCACFIRRIIIAYLFLKTTHRPLSTNCHQQGLGL